MSHSIQIKESSSFATWQCIQNYNSAEDVISLFNDSLIHERVGLFKALIITVRTHNLKDFAKDLFLPTFFNHAMKADNLAL